MRRSISERKGKKTPVQTTEDRGDERIGLSVDPNLSGKEKRAILRRLALLPGDEGLKVSALAESGWQKVMFDRDVHSKPDPTFDWSDIMLARETLDIGSRTRPGLEWFTAAEYEVKFGLKRSAAREQLRRLREAGKIETSGSGSRIYYRIRRKK